MPRTSAIRSTPRLKVEDVDGAPILRLIDKPSNTILVELGVDQDIHFTVLGNDQSDSLPIGFDRTSLEHEINVSFDGAGGIDQLIGPDRISVWQLDGTGAVSNEDGACSSSRPWVATAATSR